MKKFSHRTSSQRRAEQELSFNSSDVTSSIGGLSSSSSEVSISWGMGEQTVRPRLSCESNQVKQARSIIPQIKNEEVAKQVKYLLSIINGIIISREREKDLSVLPPLRAHVEEDGSALIEWIFPDFRIGFNIEPSPEDSGWHLVSNKKLGDAIASGLLSDKINIVKIVMRLVDYVLLHT